MRGEKVQYKKIKKQGYNLHIIKTDRFKKIQIRFNFKRPIKKEEITIRNILNDILLNSNKEYPTIRDIEIQTEELYNFGCSSHSYKSGNFHIISLTCTFLNEKYTEEGMLEKSIRFFMSLIFNPNVQNGIFDEHAFKYTCDCLKDDIESIKDNPRNYSLVRLQEELDPKGPVSYRSCGYMEDLEKITPKNLFEYYESVLKNDVVDVFVLGNVDFEEMERIVEPYVKLDRKQPRYDINHCVEQEELSKAEKEIIETDNINQSKLSIGIKVSGMNEYERKYTLNSLAFILGGGSDSKLFKTLREENSLCYYVSASPSMLYNNIIITLGIDAKEYETALNLIRDCIKQIQNGVVSVEEVEQNISVYINGCMEMYDSPGSIISNYLSHEYLGNDLLEEKMDKIKEMTPKKIIALAKKMKIDTIYLLKGNDEHA